MKWIFFVIGALVLTGGGIGIQNVKVQQLDGGGWEIRTPAIPAMVITVNYPDTPTPTP